MRSQPAARRAALPRAAWLASTLGLVLGLGIASPTSAAVQSEAGPACVEQPGPASQVLAGGPAEHHHEHGSGFSAAEIGAVETMANERLAGVPGAERRAPVRVDVVWHVMRLDRTAEHGNLSKKTIKDAIRRTNAHYAGQETGDGARTKIRFRLAEITRTTDPDWYEIGAGYGDPMKEATRVGGAETLNVWTGDVSIFAYATFPWDYERRPSDDGVTIDHTIVADPDAAYWGDRVLTHEIGHWLGLFHTTEGGCADLDQVADTPAQGQATEGCPAGVDTCPADPGLDPVRNYMGATTNVCADHFTHGQGVRMREQWRAWRV